MIKFIYGPSGKGGHSYGSFYINHNLIGLSQDERKQKLLILLDDKEISDEEKAIAKKILDDLSK